jgi:hypothetical protein
MGTLTREDWVEIYYALVDKQSTLDNGEVHEPGRDEFSDHIGRIIGTIGPDGENMYNEPDDTVRRLYVIMSGGLINSVYATKTIPEIEKAAVIILDRDREEEDSDETDEEVAEYTKDAEAFETAIKNLELINLV